MEIRLHHASKYANSRGLVVLGSVLLVLLPSGRAQSSADETVQLPAVAVTGSNIHRADEETALPVTVLDQQSLAFLAPTQPSALLAQLPEITGLPGNETANGGANARGDNSSVSLRGLPSGETLILLDGRRMAPYPISQSEDGVPALSVNVNQLPNRGLSRVEILRDGASSIYGSDAVAGVVNFITDSSFRGDELSLSYGETKYHDGQESRLTLRHGGEFASGKGRIEVVADLLDRTPIFLGQRSFSAPADNSYRAPAPWNTSTSTVFNSLSSTSAFGSYSVGTAGANNTFVAGRPAGVPTTLVAASGAFYLVPTATGTGFSAVTPARTGVQAGYYWDNNTYRVVHPQTERGSIFSKGEYDLSPALTAFVELSASQARSRTYREPDSTSNSTDGNIIVPATNPYNPFGTSYWDPNGAANPVTGASRLVGTPSAVLVSVKRFADFPARQDTVTDSVYRGVAGLRGKFLESWTWESAALWSDARVIEYEANSTRKSLLIAALNQTDPKLAFNPFGQLFAVQNGSIVVTGPYTNPESVQSTFRAPYIRNGITKLGSVDAHASGDLFKIWGGNAVSAAFGGEFRYEAFDDYRPPYVGLNPTGSGLDPAGDDFLSFSPNSDTHGNRHVLSFYGETLLPLVGHNFRLPLVRSLELTASVRHEHYGDFGDATRPKFGVNWKPANWLMLRASYNRGFDAPNLAELFNGTLTRSQTITDSYRFPATGLTSDGPSNRLSIASGNQGLKPQNSRGKSAGVVVDVPHISGLSVSADYWEIRVDNMITASGGITADTAALQAATRSALAAGQNINAVNLGSGTDAYQGDPSVVRAPVTAADQAAFAAYNATQPPGNQEAAVGSILYVKSTYFNAASQFVNGFDYNATYRLPVTPIGQFKLATDCTQLITAYVYNTVGGRRNQLLATNASNIGGADPVWRGMATLAWHRSAWTAGLVGHYTGRYSDTGASTTAAIYQSLGAPSYLTPVFTNGATTYYYTVHDTKWYDLFLEYSFPSRFSWLRGSSVRVGVNDLFNTKPPLSSSSLGYDASVYNNLAYGLNWSVQITKRI